MIHKVVIIGSGPAGLTAAIYCGRALLNPVVITGILKGGQLMNTTDVENFPGYPNGIQGPDLIDDLEKQSINFGTTFINENVIEINTNVKPYEITYGGFGTNNKIFTESIIIATGSYPLWLNAENEESLKNRGISSCAVCDGAFYKDKRCVVIGGGDQAMEDAIFLSKYASSVTIITRSEKIRASKIMENRALNNSKIFWLKGYNVIKWNEENGMLNSAVLKSSITNEMMTINCDGAFIAIGHKPSTDFVKYTGIDIDEEGYIKTYDNTKSTSVKGIFACGDVTVDNKRYKQAITASGEGCSAALDCEKYLSSL